MRDSKAARLVADVARTVRADLDSAWFLRDHPPPIRTYLAAAPSREQVPDGNGVLFAGALVWHYGPGLAVTVLGYPLVWLLQRPVTGIPTLIFLIAVTAMVTH